jgi:cytochrome c peroxidase
MKRKILLLLSGCLLVAAYPKQDLFNVPEGWPKPVYDFSKNPLNRAKIELGRRLFYDPILSADNTISCASCHSPYNAFAHTDHAVSHGIHDRFGIRNAPSLQNLAWQNNFMWDGAIHHLDMQALSPISNPDEMGESISHVVEKLKKEQRYGPLFQEAFGDSVATGERTLRAISQFLLTLVSANSRYDSVQARIAQFTTQESRGEHLFMEKCNSCHTAPLFTNGSFEKNGLKTDSSRADLGRMKVTGEPMDYYSFKVPTLRNIAYTAPYMHDGRFKRLGEVLNHYANASAAGADVSSKINNIGPLTADQKADLIAFLLTLSDRSFLFDVRHGDPWMEDRTSYTNPTLRTD